MKSAEDRLREFQTQNNIATKGPLSLVIQFTRLVRDKEFPLNSDDFQTSSKGQVAGLGGANLKKILKEHGITQQLSAEGGRTSRGSMGLMIKYVDYRRSRCPLIRWTASAYRYCAGTLPQTGSACP